MVSTCMEWFTACSQLRPLPAALQGVEAVRDSISSGGSGDVQSPCSGPLTLRRSTCRIWARSVALHPLSEHVSHAPYIKVASQQLTFADIPHACVESLSAWFASEVGAVTGCYATVQSSMCMRKPKLRTHTNGQCSNTGGSMIYYVLSTSSIGILHSSREAVACAGKEAQDLLECTSKAPGSTQKCHVRPGRAQPQRHTMQLGWSRCAMSSACMLQVTGHGRALAMTAE